MPIAWLESRLRRAGGEAGGRRFTARSGCPDDRVSKIVAGNLHAGKNANIPTGRLRVPVAAPRIARRSHSPSDLSHHFHGFRVPLSGMPVLCQFGGWNAVTAVACKPVAEEDRPDERFESRRANPIEFEG